VYRSTAERAAEGVLFLQIRRFCALHRLVHICVAFWGKPVQESAYSGKRLDRTLTDLAALAFIGVGCTSVQLRQPHRIVRKAVRWDLSPPDPLVVARRFGGSGQLPPVLLSPGPRER